jgi:exopolyphosphatase/guanosine-5'-triphosphate,3'-diphosphate pyrophosphatase
MRIGVLDIGSNSAHLKITDLIPGEPPQPVASLKRSLRLAESINSDDTIDDTAVERLLSAVREIPCTLETEHVDELIAFATSAVRDAANRDLINLRIEAETGVRLGSLTGRDEARLTFLAARAWYGFSAGTMLLLDIGGGSLEIAYGDGEEPSRAFSLPLGAGRLTRDHLPGDPPDREHVHRLRRHVYQQLAEIADELRECSDPVRVVATSKTFKQLARLTSAPKSKVGLYARRTLQRDRLRKQIPKLAKMDIKHRKKLRGISKARAHQILAGAIVAEATLTTLDLEYVDICPWAVREGIITRRMARLPASTTPDDLAGLIQSPPSPRGLRPIPTMDAS